MLRKWRLVLGLMLAALIILAGVSLAERKIQADQKPAGDSSTGDRSEGNPVKADQKSIQAGRKLFSEKCEMCHGEKADGNGEMATMIDKKPANLTDPQGVGKLTDKQIFSVLTTGNGVMPKFGSLPENDRWNLVNFIRSVEARTTSSGDDSGKKN